MKIYCEKCNSNITNDVDFRFEKILPGKVYCSHCGKAQGKMILETSLLEYLGIIETVYLLLTFIGIYVYDNLKDCWWLIFIFIVLLVAVVIFQKKLSRYLYAKRSNVITSDSLNAESIEKKRKELNTSFMIFITGAIASIIIGDYRKELLIGIIFIIVTTFCKLYFANNKK